MTTQKNAGGRVGPAIDMRQKVQPTQDRSRQTYEAILEAAAVLLEEVGVERFSTNMVCRRAKLTPPALYRYFPNKYALIKELGSRLMDAQDQAVYDWIGSGGMNSATAEEAVASNLALLGKVIEITRSQPASLWILRALRAVPAMREVRIASRTAVSARLCSELIRMYPDAPEADMRRAVRLNVEISMTVIEMILEEPEVDPAETSEGYCRLIAAFYATFAS